MTLLIYLANDYVVDTNDNNIPHTFNIACIMDVKFSR